MGHFVYKLNRVATQFCLKVNNIFTYERIR